MTNILDDARTIIQNNLTRNDGFLEQNEIDTCKRLLEFVDSLDANKNTDREVEQLDKLLKSIDIEVNDALKRFDNNEDIGRFTIIIGNRTHHFLSGGPQLEALYRFVESIAAENFYDVDIERSTVSE